jgi:hypothetical protein
MSGKSVPWIILLLCLAMKKVGRLASIEPLDASEQVRYRGRSLWSSP